MSKIWANEPYNGHLRASLLTPQMIEFQDLTKIESVKVYVPDDLNRVEMTCNGHAINVDMAQHFVKGERIAERDVYHFINRNHADRLRAGLTIHRSAFSSTPHEFETKPEAGFEEIFYFLTSGKGVLEGDGLWPDGKRVDAAWPFVNRQFAQVPMGWHRVTGLPDYDGVPPRVAYIWAYLCTKKEWEKD